MSRWLLFAVLGAVSTVLIGWGLSAGTTEPYLMLAQCFLHPASFAQDPLTHALMSAPYTLAARLIAQVCAWLCASTGIEPQAALLGLQVLAWIAQALFMYRLAYAVTESSEAAILSVLLLGTNLSFMGVDGPYNLQGLRRAICMPPLLWGLLGLVQGRRWQALLGIVGATYLHSTPGIYYWPLIVLEDVFQAYRHPGERRGAWARGAVLILMTLPFISSTGGGGHAPEAQALYMRTAMDLLKNLITGVHDAASAMVLRLEGLALVVLAIWHGRKLPGAPFLWRSLLVCSAFLALGSFSYHAYIRGWPGMRLWALAAHALPSISLCMVELAGMLAVSFWLMTELRRGSQIVPALLLLLIVSGFYQDFVLRLAALGLGVCMLMGRKKPAATLALCAAALPFLFTLEPAFFHRAAQACGLRGGLFALPAFKPAMGAALLAALALGRWLSRLSRRTQHGAFLAVAALFCLSAAGIARASSGRGAENLLRERNALADWLRENAPARSTILVSPLDAFEAFGHWSFMSRACRPVFAGLEDTFGLFLYGAAGIPLADNLSAMGMEFSKIATAEDLALQIRRMDEALTPEGVNRLAREHGVNYLILKSSHAWPDRPLYTTGTFSLYSAPVKK